MFLNRGQNGSYLEQTGQGGQERCGFHRAPVLRAMGYDDDDDDDGEMRLLRWCCCGRVPPATICGANNLWRLYGRILLIYLRRDRPGRKRHSWNTRNEDGKKGARTRHTLPTHAYASFSKNLACTYIDIVLVNYLLIVYGETRSEQGFDGLQIVYIAIGGRASKWR